MFRRVMIIVLIGLALALMRSTADAAPPEDPPVSYVVRAGDTLSSIAVRNGTTIAALMQANGIKNASMVYTGQKLALPGRAAPAAAPIVARSAAPTSSGTYVVRAGETLSGIATGHGVSIAALAQANGLTITTKVLTGQRLVIPGRAAAAAQTDAAPATAAQSSASATDSTSARAAAETQAPPDDSLSILKVEMPVEGAPTAGRWIQVNLSKQRLTAWEGSTPVYSTVISSGVPATPTLIGKFKIYTKLRSQHMSGPGYSLPGVPHVMYFVGGYAIHGAYWHNNFGRPMSHGCVNLSLPAAAWLYNWASVGTTVIVHK